MIEFNLWSESFILFAIFSPIMIIPCVLIALMGRKFIEKLGRFPTQTPFIQMSIVMKLLLIEVVTFTFLVGFYQLFEG